ncbi:putative secreted protein, SAP06/SAP48-like [Candidatus Phytoplasma luffae]|uniref:Secreted protein, SAP06/SAP48-like n=1 Tax=Loofah witches'-broom phytoplasma TaxID=35773 RepID=A0A975FJD4_LOWBP|nr:effector protein [Candidatus Phytoplasma luffae]QTX03070.1 putative secreted protein, SAP06/SAP48-like [Candidatus Phytoplasma luffae]QTX03115.1 putative secreted protein, SAP06/SAP48-like [Candidatus Phytoplasma luffae]
MIKLEKQLSLFSLFFIIFLGLLMFDNNMLYASPGINLDVRMRQLTEEQNNLIQQLNNNFNDLSLNNTIRLSRMQNIAADIERISNQINAINQQLILRDQFQRERETRNNTSNQQNNNNNGRH